LKNLQKKGDENYFTLPKPIIHRGGCNLSFAGLKTAVLKISKKIKNKEEKYHLAASFQKTIEDILSEKSKFAMNLFKKKYNNEKKIFVIAGGVASNNKIRKKLIDLSINNNFEPIFPPKNLCSDNAAMIAWAGIERFKLGLSNKLDFPAKARWPLDEKAPFLKGAGIKL